MTNTDQHVIAPKVIKIWSKKMKIFSPETTSASFGPQVTKPQVIANFRFRRIAKLKFKQFSQNVETFHCCDFQLTFEIIFIGCREKLRGTGLGLIFFFCVSFQFLFIRRSKLCNGHWLNSNYPLKYSAALIWKAHCTLNE